MARLPQGMIVSFSVFDLGEQIYRLAFLAHFAQLGQDAREMLGRVVKVDGRLILPALDERQQPRISRAHVQGIEDIAFLRAGLLHELLGGILEFLDPIRLNQHLGYNLNHIRSILSSAGYYPLF